ncbi:MAG: sel1 repeat family protein [Paludibacteraceae bacterium]|nr:sel1 repeat family protein [Paludibacteraceae bacterium]
MKNQYNIEELTKLAEKGDCLAMRKLADCYYDGIDVKQDYTKAYEWYSRIVEQQRDSEVLRRIGVYFYQNNEYKKGIDLWQESAEKGNAKAYRNLGICYYNGEGVLKNLKKAFELYTKAAELGDDVAQYNLAYCYHSGEGVNKDEEMACIWYKKAAEQGIVDAQYNLALHYFKGEGIPQNYGEATEWAKKAAKQGDKEAKKLLRHIQKYNLTEEDSTSNQYLS